MANNIRGHFGNFMNILSTCFVWTNLHMYYIRIKSHFSYIFWSKVLPHLVHTFPVPLFSPEPPKQMFSPHLHNNCSVDCLCPKSVFKKDCGQFEMISSINISSNRRRVGSPLNLILSSDQSSEPGQPGGESGIIPPSPSSSPSFPPPSSFHPPSPPLKSSLSCSHNTAPTHNPLWMKMFPASEAFLMILVTPCYWGEIANQLKIPLFSVFFFNFLSKSLNKVPQFPFSGDFPEISPSLAVDPYYLSFHFNLSLPVKKVQLVVQVREGEAISSINGEETANLTREVTTEHLQQQYDEGLGPFGSFDIVQLPFYSGRTEKLILGVGCWIFEESFLFLKISKWKIFDTSYIWP